MFLVLMIHQKMGVKVSTLNTEIEMKWTDGMVGVVPVFETKEQAEAYRGKTKAKIYEVGEPI